MLIIHENFLLCAIIMNCFQWSLLAKYIPRHFSSTGPQGLHNMEGVPQTYIP